MDKIRYKYGNTSIQRATILQDAKMAGLDVKGKNVISPQTDTGDMDIET